MVLSEQQIIYLEETVLKAVNLGDDTDTTGAVAIRIAGLYYGLAAIPERWLNSLARKTISWISPNGFINVSMDFDTGTGIFLFRIDQRKNRKYRLCFWFPLTSDQYVLFCRTIQTIANGLKNCGPHTSEKTLIKFNR